MNNYPNFNGRYEARRRTHAEILDTIDRLIAEYQDHPAGSIIRSVAAARELLLRCGVRDNLPYLVEAVVRRQLDAQVPA